MSRAEIVAARFIPRSGPKASCRTDAAGNYALEDLPGVRDCRIAAGTQNLAEQAAMTSAQLSEALQWGRTVITEASGIDLWLGGEMGIANTTSATALACALLGTAPRDLVGPGTGINSETQQHKAQVIETALALHATSAPTDPSAKALHDLQRLGGFEIAALTGAYIAAAQKGLPALVDGFICTVAALYARAINPSVSPWLMLSHVSAEPGHQQLIAQWQQPPLLRLACELHNNMATFADAGVDNQ